MANLDEQLWQACDDEDWAQAAFLLDQSRSYSNVTLCAPWLR